MSATSAGLRMVRAELDSGVLLPGDGGRHVVVAIAGENGVELDWAEDARGGCVGVAIHRGASILVVPLANVKSALLEPRATEQRSTEQRDGDEIAAFGAALQEQAGALLASPKGQEALRELERVLAPAKETSGEPVATRASRDTADDRTAELTAETGSPIAARDPIAAPSQPSQPAPVATGNALLGRVERPPQGGKRGRNR